MLRSLEQETVLLVGQTNSSVTQNFDIMDVVEKQHGQSHVRVQP